MLFGAGQTKHDKLMTSKNCLPKKFNVYPHIPLKIFGYHLNSQSLLTSLSSQARFRLIGAHELRVVILFFIV